jgi:hypothetical protein
MGSPEQVVGSLAAPAVNIKKRYAMKTIIVIIAVFALAWFLHAGMTIRVLGAHLSVGF